MDLLVAVVAVLTAAGTLAFLGGRLYGRHAGLRAVAGAEPGAVVDLNGRLVQVGGEHAGPFDRAGALVDLLIARGALPRLDL